jgi:hypothetical protein
MTDTATAAAETPVATPVSDTTSPPHPAQPGETPANDATPGADESNAQLGSGAGDPAATPDGAKGDEAEQARKKQTVQERINEVTAKRRDAERRAEAAEARAADLERLYRSPPDPNLPFEEQESLNRRKDSAAFRVDELRYEAQQGREEAWENVKAAAQAKAEAFADRMPDLWGKLKALPELSSASVKFIAESDKGAEVAYHLANNPAEASRLKSLHPLDQGIELARLEARLSVAPQVRKVSTAPAPAPTVTGNPSPAQRDPHDMNQEEYNAWRKRQLNGGKR